MTGTERIATSQTHDGFLLYCIDPALFQTSWSISVYLEDLSLSPSTRYYAAISSRTGQASFELDLSAHLPDLYHETQIRRAYIDTRAGPRDSNATDALNQAEPTKNRKTGTQRFPRYIEMILLVLMRTGSRSSS